MASTITQSASLLRRVRVKSRNRKATGSLRGARPTTLISVPGINPISRNRRLVSPVAVIALIRAFWLTAKFLIECFIAFILYGDQQHLRAVENNMCLIVSATKQIRLTFLIGATITTPNVQICDICHKRKRK